MASKRARFIFMEILEITGSMRMWERRGFTKTSVMQQSVAKWTWHNNASFFYINDATGSLPAHEGNSLAVCVIGPCLEAFKRGQCLRTGDSGMSDSRTNDLENLQVASGRVQSE